MIAFAGPVSLAAAPVLPLVLIAAWLWPALRRRMSLLLIVAPVPALLASVLATNGPGVTFWRGLVPITFVLDTPGAILLGVSSLLWIAGAVYAAPAWRSSPAGWQFAVCWLLTLAGSIGVFVAADLASFFLAYTLVSLPAYGLIVQEDTPSVRYAGAVYMAYAILGETILLMAFAFLAAATPGGSLSIQDTVSALAGSPWRGAAVALLILGFGMKIALLPLHVWMPMTYRAAPIPAAAVLSGAGVKAGIIGLIRFLPLSTALPDAGALLTAVGLVAAFYGVILGVTKDHPKTVLAYSSISQMGLIAALLGIGLAAGDARATIPTAFYAAHHVLAKGALFLAIGAAVTMGTRGRMLVLAPALILALGLGGLPLTGGALAKLAVKATFGKGLIGTLGDLSAAGTTLLMFHFVGRLRAVPESRVAGGEPLCSAGSFLALTAASVLIPWVLYPLVTGASSASVLALDALWASLWPVLLGALLAIGWFRWAKRGSHLHATGGFRPGTVFVRAASRWGGAIASIEARLRQWPAASMSLVLAAILLGAAMLVGR
jgi:formate hydrogenlyase subunit 3/multisubunit Na+/H+ antiporter MnhD subunit